MWKRDSRSGPSRHCAAEGEGLPDPLAGFQRLTNQVADAPEQKRLRLLAGQQGYEVAERLGEFALRDGRQQLADFVLLAEGDEQIEVGSRSKPLCVSGSRSEKLVHLGAQPEEVDSRALCASPRESGLTFKLRCDFFGEFRSRFQRPPFAK